MPFKFTCISLSEVCFFYAQVNTTVLDFSPQTTSKKFIEDLRTIIAVDCSFENIVILLVFDSSRFDLFFRYRSDSN